PHGGDNSPTQPPPPTSRDLLLVPTATRTYTPLNSGSRLLLDAVSQNSGNLPERVSQHSSLLGLGRDNLDPCSRLLSQIEHIINHIHLLLHPQSCLTTLRTRPGGQLGPDTVHLKPSTTSLLFIPAIPAFHNQPLTLQ